MERDLKDRTARQYSFLTPGNISFFGTLCYATSSLVSIFVPGSLESQVKNVLPGTRMKLRSHALRFQFFAFVTYICWTIFSFYFQLKPADVNVTKKKNPSTTASLSCNQSTIRMRRKITRIRRRGHLILMLEWKQGLMGKEAER